METKMNRNNGEAKVVATCLGAAKRIKETHRWVQEIIREMIEGESVKLEISVKCFDGVYEVAESWETEFMEEE